MLLKIIQEFEKYVEYKTGLKGISADKFPKKQAILKGFFAKKQAASVKKDLKEKLNSVLPDFFKKLALEGKYDQIKELADAAQKQLYHKVDQILHPETEEEYIKEGRSIKY